MVENFVAELSELVYDTSISQELFMNSIKQTVDKMNLYAIVQTHLPYFSFGIFDYFVAAKMIRSTNI